MKTPMSVFVMGIAGCFSSALLHSALVPPAAAVDSPTTLSLIQQPSLAAAIAKAQDSRTAPIVTSPSALVLRAQKGQTAVGTLLLKKSSTDQHSYHISTNQSWVWMNPPYGSTQTISSETDQLVITAQTANLSAGTYSAIVYVVDSGPNNFTNMLRIPVTLTVTATPIAATPPPPSPPAATPPPTPPVVQAPVPKPLPVVAPPPSPPATTPPPAPPVVSTTGIAASPMALALSAAKGQTAVGTLALRKGGTDQHTYYLSTNQSWVWMNPPYGSSQTISSETDQIVITAQTANLSAGTYSALVYVADSGPNNFTNMLRIPVTLTVTATPVGTTPPPPSPPAATPPPPPPVVQAPAPKPLPVAAAPPPPPPAPTPVATAPIQVSPAALALTGTNAVGTLTLRKSGSDQHVYSLSASQSWVWMNPPYGSTRTIASETDQIVITAQTTGLSAGTHSAVVYIVDSGPNNFSNTLRIPVTFTIAAGQTAPIAKPAPATPSQPTATSPPPALPTNSTPIPVATIPSSAPRTTNATVSWNANTEGDLAGYRVYVGTRSGIYSFAGPFEVASGTSFTVPNLPVGTTYYFAVSAFDRTGNESTKSAEVSKSLF